MEYTLQFAWHARTTNAKLLTLRVPPGPTAGMVVDVHPCSVTMAELHDLGLAAAAAERVAALQIKQPAPATK
jgi:hypothetical protein